MWIPRGYGEKKEGTYGLVAVAIDKDKNSQNALKWAVDHLLQKGQTVILVHVKVKPFSPYTSPLSSTRTFLFYQKKNHISHSNFWLNQLLFLVQG